jgi:hypothetical protein
MTPEESEKFRAFARRKLAAIDKRQVGIAYEPLDISIERQVTANGWIPLVTVENTDDKDVERIYLKFQVYDHDSLVGLATCSWIG